MIAVVMNIASQFLPGQTPDRSIVLIPGVLSYHYPISSVFEFCAILGFYVPGFLKVSSEDSVVTRHVVNKRGVFSPNRIFEADPCFFNVLLT